MDHSVKAWEEEIAIPTYAVGRPEKNPMFFEKRVYQGSSGVVYPHPVIEKISDEKREQRYKAVFLENEYIRMMILPQLGGRIQMAYDKVKERHFIYYNQVIKPALVGLTGPWISGGIEFNWPQHHRPSTFEPVDHTIIRNSDGSITVWVNEVERMFHTKGMAGFTLHAGKAYIEISGRLYNRTPFPQTFLWWANPAVKVNEHYQSVFPPDVYAVFDHGKRDVSSFPIARGTYYRVDYSAGVDLSRYRNIPVPTSYMAILSRFNFIGGYEHDTQGGLLHVADHHVSPGKKQWTWGNGAFGQAWDRNLTDEDGPYIELMTGVFTDNQPDFSWLQPYEEKTFTQYFMPYREVGMVKNASREAVAGMEVTGHTVLVKLHVTALYNRLTIALRNREKELVAETAEVSPHQPFIKTFTLEESISPADLELVITDAARNRELLRYREPVQDGVELPSPALAAKRPEEVENNEQLYLTGLHLEQYRHATYNPTDYYREALRRDPKDARNNNALGLWYLRRGQPGLAEACFRTAIGTLTQRNPNPYDGEPYYNLGLALQLQERWEEAFDAFYKAVWNDAWQHAGFLRLAQVASLLGKREEALELAGKSLVRNHHSHTVRHLLAALLRKEDRPKEALALIEASLGIDPFNFGCLFEKYLLLQQGGQHKEAAAAAAALKLLTHDWVHNFLAYCGDYADAGLFEEGSRLLLLHAEGRKDVYPMVYYYLAFYAGKRGQEAEGREFGRLAASAVPDGCFPNHLRDAAALQYAMTANPADARAPYYLGNFWYDKRQYPEAIRCWERSVALDPAFPTAHRNLSLAYYNKLHLPEKALEALTRAYDLDPTDARILMELDQLRKKLNFPLQDRLGMLEARLHLVLEREDLYLERVTLYNQLSRYETARALLAAFRFHPWEGGEGKVVGQYLLCHLELAKQALYRGDHEEALSLLRAAGAYPPNLGEGKLYGTQENDLHYLEGLALELAGKGAEAEACFRQATVGISEPVQAIFYNDPQPDKIFYQGLAWRKLQEEERATAIFGNLVRFGREHLHDRISIDYFAVSLPDLLVFDADLDLRNRVHCLYLVALGHLGLGGSHLETAKSLFEEVLSLDVNHQGALVHRQMIAHPDHQSPTLTLQ